MKKTKKLTDPEELKDARSKYQASVNLFMSEGQIQWSRYSAILVVNTVLIGLIGFRYSTGIKFPNSLTVVFDLTPIFGLLLCYWWLRMTERGFTWMNFWTSQANRIEDQIDGEINPVQNGKEFKSNVESEVTKNASLWIIRIIGLIYFVITVINLSRWEILSK